MHADLDDGEKGKETIFIDGVIASTERFLNEHRGGVEQGHDGNPHWAIGSAGSVGAGSVVSGASSGTSGSGMVRSILCFVVSTVST